MGLKFKSIIYDSRKLVDRDIVSAIKDIVVNKEIDMFTDVVIHDDKIRSILGSKLITLLHEHSDYHFKMLLSDTLNECERFIFDEENIAKELSEKFRDITFFCVAYYSGSSTGWLVGYENGIKTEEVSGVEGDSFKSARKVLNKHFGIKNVYDTFSEYFLEYQKYSPYSVSGYAFLKYCYEKYKNSSDSFGDYYINQYNGVIKLLECPNISTEKLLKYSNGYPKEFLMCYVENYYAVKNNSKQSKIFSLTTGYAWSEGGAYFLDEPVYLSPVEYFKLMDLGKEEQEKFKKNK